MNTLMPRDGVTFCTTEHGAVVLDTAAGHFYGLDPVAATAWTALTAGGDIGDAITAVLARFDIDEPTARTDLTRLITELREGHLLVSTP
jgi:hypothetical protein